MTPEGTTAKKGAKPCDLEQAADTWTEHAEIMAAQATAARDTLNEILAAKKGGGDLERVADTWMEYANILATGAYARGRAAGLRQALEIIGREKHAREEAHDQS